MWDKTFWKDAAERAIKSFAQALLAVFTVGAAVPVWDLGWKEAVGGALTMALLSVLTSLVSGKVGNPETASLVTTTAPGGGEALIQGALAAERAGYPTANPQDPLPSDPANYPGELSHSVQEV